MKITTTILTLGLCAFCALAQPSRPQTPEAPFPYESIDMLIDATDEGMDQSPWSPVYDGFTHVLGATLTLPDPEQFGEGPYPGVVMITGSGPQDRDETIMAHKPFLVIADHLTRHGIAVLRMDDRGIGKSTGVFGLTSVEQHARDAWFGVRYMIEHPRVHASQVGIIGHSQGGMVAPYLALHDPDVAFIVMLAGTGVSGAEVLIDQTELMYMKTDLDEDYVNAAIERRRVLFDRMCAGVEKDELLDLVKQIAITEFRVPDDDNAMKLAEQMLPQFNSAPMRSFICHDPRDSLPWVNIPVLALNGSLDTQVTPRLNLDTIRETLEKAGNRQSTIIELTGLNHLFQHAKIGAVGEYGTIEETIAPEVLGILSSWINATSERIAPEPDEE
jgi:hypothetical protein